MRRLLIFALAAVLCLSVCACGIRNDEKNIGGEDRNGEDDKSDTEKAPDAEPSIPEKNIADGEITETPANIAAAGVLHKLPLCDDRAITGLIAVSAKSPAGTLEENIIKGYKTEGINSDFHLDEPIELYLTTALVTPFFNICFVTDDGSSGYAGMTAKQLEARSLAEGLPILWGVCPDSESFGYVGTATVSSANASPGAYYVFFITDNKPMYMLRLDITR